VTAPAAHAPGVTPTPTSTPARTGVWVGMAAISMSFAAFTSALIVREGPGSDWQHFRLPPVLYVNTLVLLASSALLEVSRRRRRAGAPARGWLAGSGLLGVLFLAGQILAWRALAAQGVFLATSPSGAFFYVLTVVHAVHVLGGLAGLAYAYGRLVRTPVSAAGVLTAAATYWHFMAALWLYVLFVLVARI